LVKPQPPKPAAPASGSSATEAFIHEAAVSIAGKNADGNKINWVEENIRTIRQAVQAGRHSTGYYPASGEDGLRVLIAYDLDILVTCDKNENLIGATEVKLNELGVEFSKNYDEANKRKEITFKLPGRPGKRKIIEHYKDVKDLDLSAEFSSGKVDVVHTYLPNLAQDYIRFEDMLKFTNEGGFLCDGENDQNIPYREALIPQSLYEMSGLKKIEIIQRQPYTVTNYARVVEELPKQPTKGIIFQKEREVKDEIRRLLWHDGGNFNIVSFMKWLGRNIDGVLASGFSYIGSEDLTPKTLENFLIKDKAQFISRIKTFTEKLEALGVTKGLLETFQQESLTIYIREWQHLRSEYKRLLDKCFNKREY